MSAADGRLVVISRLFLILAILLVADLLVLIRLGELLTFWPTVGLLTAGTWAGVALLRFQSRRMAAVIGVELNAGRMPGAAVLDGLAVLLAAVLLIMPGYASDLVALLLMLPPVRRRVARTFTRRFHDRAEAMTFWSVANWRPEPPSSGAGGNKHGPGEPVLPRPGVKYVRNEALNREE